MCSDFPHTKINDKKIKVNLVWHENEIIVLLNRTFFCDVDL